MSSLSDNDSDQTDDAHRWLLTYADLLTLLMAFFVLMYAMSHVTPAKYQELSQTLSQAFKATPQPEQEANARGLSGALQDKELFSALLPQQALSQGAAVVIGQDEREVALRLPSAVLFADGTAELSTEAEHLLDTLAPQLSASAKNIRIEGHTDNSQPSRPFSNNWQLSSARANAVLMYLIDQHHLDPHRLSAAGYAEYHPVAPNDSETNRAQNRRVEIKIVEED